MVVGEPSLMGGEFGDEDERLITRLENTQYEGDAGDWPAPTPASPAKTPPATHWSTTNLCCPGTQWHEIIEKNEIHHRYFAHTIEKLDSLGVQMTEGSYQEKYDALATYALLVQKLQQNNQFIWMKTYALLV